MSARCKLFGHGEPSRATIMSRLSDGSRSWVCPDCGMDADHGSMIGPLPKLVRTVWHGDIIPSGYGVAWVRVDRDAAVCMPVPINLIAGLARRAWIWLRWGWLSAPAKPASAYWAGHHAGYQKAISEMKSIAAQPSGKEG